MTTAASASMARFRALHESGCFVMPNPFDVGSARLLEAMGFEALATTSSGFAATLGRADMSVTLDELVTHTAAVAGAVDVPVNVDAERCFGETLVQVTAAVAAIARAGAAGCSIEDWNPMTGAIDPIGLAAERVEAATGSGTGIVVTARCEDLLRGVDDLDDVVARLRAYRDAGADVVYAPGLRTMADVERVVAATDAPVNVVAVPGGPSVDELAAAGVRRISVGGRLLRTAYGAVVDAASALRTTGALPVDLPAVPADLAERAFLR